MRNVEREILEQAVDRLSRTERGNNAMRHILEWLDNGGTGLDAENQEAVITILRTTWGGFAGSARELMRKAIQRRGEK